MFFYRHNTIRRQAGFTLLEMIIAMGIFVIMFTITLGIYSYALKAEQKTIQFSKLQKESQLIMEVVAKKIRYSEVDYDWYNNGSGEPLEAVENSLALLDKYSNRTVFSHIDNNISVCNNSDCLLEEDYYPISAQNITVTELDFYIDPLTSPFSLNNPPIKYPKITIVMNLRHTHGSLTRDLRVQQTIPQRLSGF